MEFSELQLVNPPDPKDDVDGKFCEVLKQFRINFGDQTIDDVVSQFKTTVTQHLLESYTDLKEEFKTVENWVLETKLWDLVEVLLKTKFVKQQQQQQQLKAPLVDDSICSYTSNAVLQDKIVNEDNELKEILNIIEWLSKTFVFDVINVEDTVDFHDLQTSKWLHTKIDIQSGSHFSLALVKNLDADAPLRSSKNNTINEKDKLKDELFFKKAFHLLLSNNIDDLIKLCETTNNWNFAMTLAGLSDFVDPAIDLNDYETKPAGVKHKVLLRRTLYQLSQSLSEGFEKGCYGYLAGDFPSTEPLTSSWEKKLLLYLNNLFKCKLENQLIQCYRELNDEEEMSLFTSFSSPTQVVESVGEALNLLAVDSNDRVRRQSEHPIRVLIGSVISDNVQKLMQSSITLLNQLFLSDKEEVTSNNDKLIQQPFLLRILVHLAILIQLIYGEEFIPNGDYTQLLKSYSIRLAESKQYSLIPIYISFIPNDKDLIETYSHFLASYHYTHDEREEQIKLMRELGLPMEAILKETVSSVFDSTESFYPVNGEIVLEQNVSEIDQKLYSSIYWYYDSGMTEEALKSIQTLFRRFLLCGKVDSTIEFFKSISLPLLIQEQQRKRTLANSADIDMLDNDDDSFPPYKIQELVHYKNLIDAFQQIKDFGEMHDPKLEDVTDVAFNADVLMRSWFFDLLSDENTTEDDKETYSELRRTYIPSIFNTIFDILINFRSLSDKLLVQQAACMVNLLSDDHYKLYELFVSRDELKPFLQKFANISCELFGELENGIFV